MSEATARQGEHCLESRPAGLAGFLRRVELVHLLKKAFRQSCRVFKVHPAADLQVNGWADLKIPASMRMVATSRTKASIWPSHCIVNGQQASHRIHRP